MQKIYVGVRNGEIVSSSAVKEHVKTLQEKYALDIHYKGRKVAWEQINDPGNIRTIFQHIIEDRRLRNDHDIALADRPPFVILWEHKKRIVRLEYYEGHDTLQLVYDIYAPKQKKRQPSYSEGNDSDDSPLPSQTIGGLAESMVENITGFNVHSHSSLSKEEKQHLLTSPIVTLEEHTQFFKNEFALHYVTHEILIERILQGYLFLCWMEHHLKWTQSDRICEWLNKQYIKKSLGKETALIKDLFKCIQSDASQKLYELTPQKENTHYIAQILSSLYHPLEQYGRFRILTLLQRVWEELARDIEQQIPDIDLGFFSLYIFFSLIGLILIRPDAGIPYISQGRVQWASLPAVFPENPGERVAIDIQEYITQNKRFNFFLLSQMIWGSFWLTCFPESAPLVLPLDDAYIFSPYRWPFLIFHFLFFNNWKITFDDTNPQETLRDIYIPIDLSTHVFSCIWKMISDELPETPSLPDIVDDIRDNTYYALYPGVSDIEWKEKRLSGLSLSIIQDESEMQEDKDRIDVSVQVKAGDLSFSDIDGGVDKETVSQFAEILFPVPEDAPLKLIFSILPPWNHIHEYKQPNFVPSYVSKSLLISMEAIRMATTVDNTLSNRKTGGYVRKRKEKKKTTLQSSSSTTVTYIPRMKYAFHMAEGAATTRSSSTQGETRHKGVYRESLVTGHIRQIPRDWQASDSARKEARKWGIDLPKAGFTFVRPYTRGATSEENMQSIPRTKMKLKKK